MTSERDKAKRLLPLLIIVAVASTMVAVMTFLIVNSIGLDGRPVVKVSARGWFAVLERNRSRMHSGDILDRSA